jgi:hypothetical protein
VRIAHRFIGGTRASEQLRKSRRDGRKARARHPSLTGLRESAAIIVPSTEDAGLLSEIPPGLRLLNGRSPTFNHTLAD